MFHVEHQIQQRTNYEAAHKAVSLFQKHEKQLNAYIDKLLWWNERVNLVSRNVSRETIANHVQHSLYPGILGLLDDFSYIIDSGTGGGLPGIPLAICYPDKKFLFNDIVKKKVMAVQAMSRKLGLKNTSDYTGSVEELPFDKGELLISKHAFKINNLTKMLSDSWDQMVLLKGMDFEKELSETSLPLQVEVWDLYELTKEAFYEGKAVLKIRRKNEQQ